MKPIQNQLKNCFLLKQFAKNSAKVKNNYCLSAKYNKEYKNCR